VGWFVLAQQGMGMLGALLWARVSARSGNRVVIRLSAAGTVVLAVYGLALAWWAAPLSSALSVDVRAVLFFPAFGLLGIVGFGEVIGYSSFAINIAPEERRPTYIGLMNTVMGVVGFLPAVGGVLADAAGLAPVFAIALGSTAAGLACTLRLRNTRREREA
jgi:hypothetical protein